MKIDNIDEIFNKPLDKKCLLYSGGSDSYIISKLEDFDFLLYINSKSKYAALEIEFLKEQGIEVIIDDRLDLSDVEMSSAYVPLRNLFFSMIAVLHGASEIVIGATSGDRANDKNKEFAKLSNDVLNHQLQEAWWHPGSNININLKYKSWTKKQLVDAYLEKGYSIDDLVEKSISCYTPIGDKQCGRCKPCVRKWLFMLPYKDTSYMYDTNPRDFYTDDYIQEIKDRQNTKLARGEEDVETLEIYNKYIKVLDEENKEYINKEHNEYKYEEN